MFQVVQMEPGSGPRHLVFHPTDPVLFVVCELSNTLEVLIADSHSDSYPTPVRVRVLNGTFDSKPCSRNCVHPSGERVYVSNRETTACQHFNMTSPQSGVNSSKQLRVGGPTLGTSFSTHQGLGYLPINPPTPSPARVRPQTLVPHNPDVVAEVSSPTCIILQESPS